MLIYLEREPAKLVIHSGSASCDESDHSDTRERSLISGVELHIKYGIKNANKLCSK